MYSALRVLSFLVVIICTQVYGAADPMWRVDDLMRDVKSKPIGSLVTELTQKATGEFDKLYHQLEGVLGQLTGRSTQEDEAQLDPQTMSQCSCYCRCPHDTVDSKVVAKVKESVQELQRKVESVAKSLKEKIHDITAK